MLEIDGKDRLVHAILKLCSDFHFDAEAAAVLLKALRIFFLGLERSNRELPDSALLASELRTPWPEKLKNSTSPQGRTRNSCLMTSAWAGV